MGEKIEVLDHGYVELIESWGSDERIIEAARMSTGKGFLGWGPRVTGMNNSSPTPSVREIFPDYLADAWRGAGCPSEFGHTVQYVNVREESGDEKLLRFLYTNSHMTPFEMGGMIIEVQAPIFVFREWHRHRTQSYNELSARYTPLPDFSYTPTIERCMLSSTRNKQAQSVDGANVLTEQAAYSWIQELKDAYIEIERVYSEGLKIGIPKELARLPVSVSRYSRMRASTVLRNWLAFITLRSDDNPGAQWEIRQYGNVVDQLVKQCFPRVHELFREGR
jgi:thymidylate synthase (FAD)